MSREKVEFVRHSYRLLAELREAKPRVLEREVYLDRAEALEAVKLREQAHGSLRGSA
jgi:hypothetical protein